MTEDCIEARASVAAYVLGALDAESRSEVERHISYCNGCRDELASLAGMPAVLSRLTEADLLAEDDAPGDLLERTLVELRSRKQRSRRRTVLLAAAASVAIFAGGGAAVAVTHTSKTPSITATAGAVSVRFALHQRATGTAITLWMHGVNAGENCRLITVSRSGASETAATWIADYAGHVNVNATTSFARQDIAALEIVDHAGNHLVTATL